MSLAGELVLANLGRLIKVTVEVFAIEFAASNVLHPEDRESLPSGIERSET